MIVVRMHLILTAFAVNLVLMVSGYPGESIVLSKSELSDDERAYLFHPTTDVAINLRSLMHSVAKSDGRRSEIYRDILRQSVAYGQQVSLNPFEQITQSGTPAKAFDAAKDSAKTVRNRNAERRRISGKTKTDPYYNNVAIAKRAAEDEDPLKLEERFMEIYGDNYTTSGRWPYSEKNHMDDEKLLDVSEQAHALSRKPPGEVVLAQWHTRKLKFMKGFRTIEVDLIFYLLAGEPVPGEQFYFYITKGFHPECVLYLNGTELQSREYVIAEHVCGIKLK